MNTNVFQLLGLMNLAYVHRITQQLSQNIVPMTAYVTLNPDVTIMENNGVNSELALDTYSCRC
jgi:hypothetical protein